MTNRLNVLDWIVLTILIIGGLNWGLVGIFDFNLVESLFGTFTALTRTIYAIVGLSAIYVAGIAIFRFGMASTTLTSQPPKAAAMR